MKHTLWIVLSICRLGLGIMFLWSSVPKIVYPERFAASVAQFGLVSGDLSTVAAALIPWLELVLGICLISSMAAVGALVLTVALLSLFTLLQGWVLYHGIEVDCTCFNVLEGGKISAATLGRNVALWVISLVTLVGILRGCQQRRPPIDSAVATLPANLSRPMTGSQTDDVSLDSPAV